MEMKFGSPIGPTLLDRADPRRIRILEEHREWALWFRFDNHTSIEAFAVGSLVELRPASAREQTVLP